MNMFPKLKKARPGLVTRPHICRVRISMMEERFKLSCLSRVL